MEEKKIEFDHQKDRISYEKQGDLSGLLKRYCMSSEDEEEGGPCKVLICITKQLANTKLGDNFEYLDS